MAIKPIMQFDLDQIEKYLTEKGYAKQDRNRLQIYPENDDNGVTFTIDEKQIHEIVVNQYISELDKESQEIYEIFDLGDGYSVITFK